jgi:hypothetical protein
MYSSLCATGYKTKTNKISLTREQAIAMYKILSFDGSIRRNKTGYKTMIFASMKP